MPVRVVPEQLRPYVSSIVGYHDRPAPDTVHHGLPSPSLTVLVVFDEPLDSGWLTTPDEHDTYWTAAAGLHLEPALIRTHGHQHGIQLALTPQGCRALLGLPAGALAGVTVAHEALPGGIGVDVHDQLSATIGWDARFALLEEALLARVSAWDRTHGSPEVAEAWRLLGRSGGRLRVAELAERTGWSRRRLLARFTAEYGIGPKQAARLFRFQRARRLLDRGLPLADLAVECGFADQSHLTREWVALAGRTPREAQGPTYHAPRSHLFKTDGARAGTLDP